MNYAMFLYIDPATGGMLFTVLFGLVSAAVYFVRSIILKIKYSFSVDRVDKKSDNSKLPIVIFSDHKRYWNVFEPICAELEKRNQQAYYYTMSKDDPALDKQYTNIHCEYIGSGNKAFSKMNMLKATIVVSTTPSLDVFQWKRSKDVDYYIHIPHMSNDITLYRMFGIDYFDAILLSGDYQIKQVRELEKVRKLPAKDLKLVGVPYMDTMKKRLETDAAISNKKTENVTVILAPSWGDNGILKKYGTSLIDKLIGTGYDIIVRPHPQSIVSEKDMLDELMEKYNSAIKWNTDNDNFEVLKKADVLISDFSGVIFDFALVYDKPVIFTEPDFDKSKYDCAWLDEELWTYTILDKIGIELNSDNIEDIKAIIDNCIKNDKFAEGRKQARMETWVNIGEGAVKATDYIINKYNEKTVGVQNGN